MLGSCSLVQFCGLDSAAKSRHKTLRSLCRQVVGWAAAFLRAMGSGTVWRGSGLDLRAIPAFSLAVNAMPSLGWLTPAHGCPGFCLRRRKTWQQAWAVAEFQFAHPSSTPTMRMTMRMRRRTMCRTPTLPSGQLSSRLEALSAADPILVISVCI